MSTLEVKSDNRPSEPADEVRTTPSSSPTRPAHLFLGASDRDWGTPTFVWGGWALMLLATLMFVMRYGSNIPYGDEWWMVPQLTGDKPVNASWLWEQHNEHRNPLPKLILVGLFRLTGDFRARDVLERLGPGEPGGRDDPDRQTYPWSAQLYGRHLPTRAA